MKGSVQPDEQSQAEDEDADGDPELYIGEHGFGAGSGHSGQLLREDLVSGYGCWSPYLVGANYVNPEGF